VNPEINEVVNNPDVMKPFHVNSAALQKRTRKPLLIVNPGTHEVINKADLDAKDETADVREKFKRLITLSLPLIISCMLQQLKVYTKVVMFVYISDVFHTTLQLVGWC